MKVETVKCDECGAIKGESNHWLAIDVRPESISEGNQLISIGFKNVPSPNFNRRDLCGQACFYKHLDGLLFAGKKE